MEPITEEELGGVVANMAHEKSLGIDKFTKKCCYKVLQRMLGCYGTWLIVHGHKFD